ncbi:MAG: hypothetical protein ACK5LK_11970 [Chthoniobacterales bacterium]
MSNDSPSPEQIAIWKKMTPEQKVDVFSRLMHNVRSLKYAGVKYEHPDWSDEQVNKEVARYFLYART